LVARGPIRILELRSVRGTGGGPEKTIMYGAARSDPARFAITVCYIRDQRDGVFALHDLARQLGVDYVEVNERHSFDHGVWPQLRRLVRDRGIEIVHSHEYKTDVLALLLDRAERVTALATAHGWTGHSPRERLLYYPLDRFVLKRFARVVAVSEQIRQTLVACGSRPERVTTILNGIDPERFIRRRGGGDAIRRELNIPADAVVVGSVGRIEPQKRFDLLVDAFARFLAVHPKAVLLIAGSGSEEATLRDLARQRGLNAACRLPGHRADVIAVLHAIDLYVQSSDYEGTPNSILEAMAMELPIVATTAGGTDQLVRDAVDAILIPPGDAGPIADAMLQAWADPVAAAERVRSARRRVETDLSFAARMRKLESIYNELAEARRA
jgi:glycosyltransferase involved in cell wall biosynthesis